MGRKILMSAAIVAATFGVVAGSAFASSTATFGVVARSAFASSTSPSVSNGTKPTAKQRALVESRMRALPSTAMTTGTAYVLRTGAFSECTVPEGHGAYQNFFTRDTTTYLETDTATPTLGLLIGTCTADLTKKQTSATSTDHPSGQQIIPTPGRFAAYSEKCELIYQNLDWIGDAESVVYPDGEFDETCVVPVNI